MVLSFFFIYGILGKILFVKKIGGLLVKGVWKLLFFYRRVNKGKCVDVDEGNYRYCIFKIDVKIENDSNKFLVWVGCLLFLSWLNVCCLVEEGK